MTIVTVNNRDDNEIATVVYFFFFFSLILIFKTIFRIMNKKSKHFKQSCIMMMATLSMIMIVTMKHMKHI